MSWRRWGACAQSGSFLTQLYSWPNSQASGSFLPVLELLHVDPVPRFRLSLRDPPPASHGLAQCLPHSRGSIMTY